MVSIQRHVALLRSELRPGEQERVWVRAEHLPEGYVGALLLSDRRLLFSGLGFVQQLQTAWPLAVLDGSRVVDGRLEVVFAGRTERFTGKPADLARVAGLLGAAPPTAPVSTTDELERLAALHASGALTDAEFAAAKRRVLGG